jgi:phage terminase large subunit GpA-like protein
MDALADPYTEKIVVKSSAQIGKSEILLNVLGYHIHLDPCPILLLQPTTQMAENFSKTRVSPMIRDTKVLTQLVEDPKARNSNNTILQKHFQGGSLSLSGANSPASLSSRPIRLLLIDEVSRMSTAGAEGDAVNLAIKRTTTFFNRKIFLVSTPQNKGSCRISEAFEDSDQRKFWVPCPHCQKEQVLLWKQVKWEANRPETATYTCQHCKEIWSEGQRLKAIQQGQWKAEEEFRGTAGFWLNALYSPWARLPELVQEFLEAKENPEQLKVFINTVLAEEWDATSQAEKIDDLGLYNRREKYISQVPDQVELITAGIDVQDDRLEISTIGHGTQGKEIWAIDHAIIFEDPASPSAWEELTHIITTGFTRSDGSKAYITAACIDSGGHHTGTVYDYCKRVQLRRGQRLHPIKGVGGEGKPILGRPSRNNSGRVQLFPMGSDTAKELIYSRLKIQKPGAGFIHFPELACFDLEYFQQLTAERIQIRFHKGYRKREWVKARPRNEALDCFAMALAALASLNVRRWASRPFRRAEEAEELLEEPEETKKPPDPVQRLRRQRRGGNGWMNL